MGSYEDIHFCDYGVKNTTHQNYLGSIIAGPFASIVDTDSSHGVIGHCMLTNGHYTLRIWDNVFPAEISLEVFLEDDLPDIDLIVDHLSAPAIPNDGLGLFDYTFSVTTSSVPSSGLRKSAIGDSSYHINSPISFIGEDKKDWEITLNKLKETECYYCKNSPYQWIFIDDCVNCHLNFRSVLVCKEHVGMGRVGEIVSGSNNSEELDYHTSKDGKMFIMEDVVDENNNKLFTKNIEVKNKRFDN